MSDQKQPQQLNKIPLNILAIILLVGGVSLILLWWKDIVIFFRAIAGIGLALAGLLIMYFQKHK